MISSLHRAGAENVGESGHSNEGGREEGEGGGVDGGVTMWRSIESMER